MPIENPDGEFSPVKMVFSVYLANFPEWAIPFTRIIPKVYLDDAYSPEDFTGSNFDVYCRYWWQYVDGVNWKLYVEVRAAARLDGEYIPTYLDIDLVINNEKVWEEFNSNKS